MTKPSDTTSARIAEAITVLFLAIWPVTVGLSGLVLVMYEGFSGTVNSLSFGGGMIMMGFGAGGLFDAISNRRRPS